MYATAPSLVWPAKFCVFITLETWVHSIVTNNLSQVDRLWTVLPTFYSAYYVLLPLWPRRKLPWLAPYVPEELSNAAADFSPRAVLMLALIVMWMCRLTYNTWRRGLLRQLGYIYYHHSALHSCEFSSAEDYRWGVLRREVSPFLFQATNLVFVAITQNILLLSLSLPTHTAVLQPHTALAKSDYLLALTAIAILALEFTADNQHYAFHAYKHAYMAQKKNDNSKEYDPRQHWFGARLDWQPKDAERGFCTKGLWAFSRHPNFACEQMFWIVITAFPILSPDLPFVATFSSFSSFLPAFSLCLLFWASTIFTESITASKYRAYAAYQKRVAMFSPISTLLFRALIFSKESENSENTE